MTYPDFIVCSKCKSRWDTRMGYHPESFDDGICPACGHPLKEEYKPIPFRAWKKKSEKYKQKIIKILLESNRIYTPHRWWKESK